MIYRITDKEERILQKLEALGVKMARMRKRAGPTTPDAAHFDTIRKWIKEIMSLIREE